MAITSYSSSTPNDAVLLEQVWGALSGPGNRYRSQAGRNGKPALCDLPAEVAVIYFRQRVVHAK
ncbi:hypothetical protein SARI_04156 [Salmonella enterica subsp. arizonae serovar 62:z4,z23:-]|uniref:Uncharacterized protein n=1 Tax=Salmonella arizonae (strain ATCC BAA-731 / CDC346-86 / RSK2980) TaxID=41514 RepID=A9MN14_SALAR|nr:hypothetical protein SARI_04156 [Salmonella enterica subsp. arizonae serovar 62:z4,z23:-]